MTQSTEQTTLLTPRLRLRQWRADDYPAFARLNADAEVMAYYPSILSRGDSDAMAVKLENLITQRGWGLWATEIRETGNFIGFVGLHEPQFLLPVSPCVEIGWRLAREYWGNGYATEAAAASLNFAFDTLALENVFSFASVGNQRSRAVMERLGMQNLQQNFLHPMIPENNPLREHVLYRIDRESWEKMHLNGTGTKGKPGH